MGDDLQNNWGVNYAMASPWRGRRTADPDAKLTKDAVAAATNNEFFVQKILPNGSEANTFAVIDASNFNTLSVLFGVACYIAGDSSILQPCSTSKFDIGYDLAMIMTPHEVSSEIAKSNVVPLPYHIPGCISNMALEKHENRVLMSLQTMLIRAKVANRPFTVLLLELVLAANGAVLSDRALTIIGFMAKEHGLKIIVDEIMTAGRTSSEMVLGVQTKPKEFQEVASHVTLGKWLQVGLILCSKKVAQEKDAIRKTAQRRGTSAELDVDGTVLHWEEAVARLGDVHMRRAKVLKQLRITEAEAWGEGLMIFSQKINTSAMQGLRARLLPQIAIETPIEKGMKFGRKPGLTKDAVNRTIVQSVIAWVDRIPPTNYVDLTSEFDWTFCNYVAEHCKEGTIRSSKDWIATVFGKREISKKMGEATLSRLRAGGFMQSTLVGAKRNRVWVVKDSLIPPWKRLKTSSLNS